MQLDVEVSPPANGSQTCNLRQTESDAYEPTVQKHRCAQKLGRGVYRKKINSECTELGCSRFYRCSPAVADCHWRYVLPDGVDPWFLPRQLVEPPGCHWSFPAKDQCMCNQQYNQSAGLLGI